MIKKKEKRAFWTNALEIQGIESPPKFKIIKY